MSTVNKIPTTLDILKLLGKPGNWRTVGSSLVWIGSVSPIDLIVEAIESTLKYEADTTDRFRLAIGKQISQTEYQRAEVARHKQMLESIQLGLTASQNLVNRFCELAGAPGDPLEATSRLEHLADEIKFLKENPIEEDVTRLLEAERDRLRGELFVARELYQNCIELCREAERYVNYPEPSFMEFVGIVRRWAVENRAILDEKKENP